MLYHPYDPTQKLIKTLMTPATSPALALSELQSQLHDTQTSLANRVNKIHTLKNVFAQRGAIKREVEMLLQLVEKPSSPRRNDVRGRERHEHD